jgi:hypothetical protein
MLRIAAITVLMVAVGASSGCGSAGSAGLNSQPVQTFAPASISTSSVTITSISPTSAVAGSPNVTVTVTGMNFVQGFPITSLAVWSANGNQTLLDTNFISGTQLKAVIPASLLMNPGTAQIFIENGDPMGISDGTSYPKSNSFAFSVIAPSGTTTPPTPSPTPTPTPTPTPAPAPSAGLNGNWTGTFTADMGPGHSVDASISGPLTEFNGTLAPTGLVLGSSMCFAAVLVRSGTISGSTVKMEMIAADFAAIDFSGTLSGDRLSGTFRIDGSECGSGTGTLSMTKIASITGNWAGTLRTDATKLESAVTLSLTQTSTILTSTTNNGPFSISSLKVTGVIQQAGSGCILQVFSAAPGVVGGIQGLALNLKSNDSSGIALDGSVNLSSTAIAGTYHFLGNSCNGETGTFTLNRL